MNSDKLPNGIWIGVGLAILVMVYLIGLVGYISGRSFEIQQYENARCIELGYEKAIISWSSSSPYNYAHTTECKSIIVETLELK